MTRSHVDEWLETQALTKHSSRHNEETNININRTQASGPERNNGQKLNHCINKDNYRKRKHSSDNDLDYGYSSYYINEVGDKVYKKARTDYRNQRVNSFATGAKDDKHRNNRTGYEERKDCYRKNGGRTDTKPGIRDGNKDT